MASIRDQSSAVTGVAEFPGEGRASGMRTSNGMVFAFMTPGWRARLREASFKGAAFHVEQQGRVSGRRTVVHEYPKRDDPYAEDLGRHAVRYQITGYVIQKTRVQNPQEGFRFRGRSLSPIQGREGSNFASIEYDICRDTLVQALESWGPGVLIDPYNNRIDETSGRVLFQCERYTMVESRERGGYAQFDMAFVEAGLAAYSQVPRTTIEQIWAGADRATAGAATQLNAQQAQANNGTPVVIPEGEE
jgi:DNA circularisation protein N-terminus